MRMYATACLAGGDGWTGRTRPAWQRPRDRVPINSLESPHSLAARDTLL